MKIKFAFIALILIIASPAQAMCSEISDLIKNSDVGKMSDVAEIITNNAEINMIGAQGAVQISQVADQAQLKFSAILIRQNDEIIKLLRSQVKNKK
jgi:hypothetical protein